MGYTLPSSCKHNEIDEAMANINIFLRHFIKLGQKHSV